MLREDAHSAQGYMVAEATAPRRENVPRHILFITFITAAVQSDAARTVQTSSPPTASSHTALLLPCTPGKYLQNPLVPSAQPHTDAEKRHFQNGNTDFCNPG